MKKNSLLSQEVKKMPKCKYKPYSDLGKNIFKFYGHACTGGRISFCLESALSSIKKQDKNSVKASKKEHGVSYDVTKKRKLKK